MQKHHIIPREIFEQIDDKKVKTVLETDNEFLIELPSSKKEAGKYGLYLYHDGSHPQYTEQIMSLLECKVDRSIQFYLKFADGIRNCLNFHLKNSKDGITDINGIKIELMSNSDVEDFDFDGSVHASDSDVY